ncbi:PQQ-binding-like beta-propeller repeat protein [Halobaculum limi]|uniref:outer membrane protein assembly factor BamB family protein n=1 Tax=Halobaculum limi TaxID=3031916 RepID=UPI0024053DF6|nr:PQQ-binding-like beta-propeller repeat protein [Halobaculum sp. YSMS11]
MVCEGLSRRSFAQLLASIGVTSKGIVQSAGATQAVESDWPQFRYNSQNTAFAPDESGPKESIWYDWYVNTEVAGGDARAEPTIADGNLLFTDAESIHSVAIGSGSIEWSQSVGQVTGSMAVRDGEVYFVTNQGQLGALDAQTGARQWRLQLEPNIIGSPTVTESHIFASSSADIFYAVERDSGSQDWTFSTEEGRGSWPNNSPAVHEGTVFIPTHTGRIHALNVDDGEEEWMAETKAFLDTPPVVTDEIVVAGGYNSDLVAYSTTGGYEQWRVTGAGRFGAPAVANQTVFVTHRSGLTAYDADDGTERWTYSGVPGVVGRQPIVADGVVYVGGDRLVALDAETGSVFASFNPDYTQHGDQYGTGIESPVIADGTIFARDEYGGVYALSAQTKAVIKGPRSGDSLEELSFSADGSATPSGSIESFEWRWEEMDLSLGSGPQLSTRLYLPGAQTLSLTVRDTNGNTATSTREVNVHIGNGARAIAGAGLIAGTGLLYRRHRRNPEPDAETGGSDSASGDDQQSTEAVQQTADAEGNHALEEGNQALADQDYETAISCYEAAIASLTTAQESLPRGDDQREEIEERLATARAKLQTARDHQTAVEKLTEALLAAEQSLRTAVTEHGNGQQTIVKLRYRQARDQYEDALEQLDTLDIDPFGESGITVTFDTSSDTVPQDPSIVDELEQGEGSTLDEAGIDSEDAYVEATEEDIAKLSPLRRLAVQVWFDDQGTTTFPDRAAIVSRRDVARRGLDLI